MLLHDRARWTVRPCRVPNHARPELEKAFVAPRTSVEEVLADIWSQVLRIEQVGVHDRFFELGGDSILSIQVIARANKAGLRLTLKQIFQHQTIAELALVAEAVTHPRFEQGLDYRRRATDANSAMVL